ncbi:hypothetical protein RMSM_04794 [Rhodopirellula maiorica SM1]|uniref:Uncharacterized protein n=1 Tax=Rhodopirellula maiorica SM1 TaxID=1265738 RepID=M5RGN4_9BACT|nr:hypothetical protein RMSM_04794 [Rhodopirellula maiorica SM1]
MRKRSDAVVSSAVEIGLSPDVSDVGSFVFANADESLRDFRYDVASCRICVA